jgi:uncharacterized protein (DUF433 family)
MRNGLSTTTALITRREAAELSGATLGAVNKAIEQRVLRARRRRGRVLLVPEDAGVLTLLSQTRVSLPVAAKRRVADWVRSRPSAHAELQLDSALLVRMLPETEKTIEHTQRYVELRDRLVEIDPQVRGGEPVIKGTRVPIRGLARQIELGETLDVLREDYPFLPDEAFELAPVWARANPRQGRPARPWTSGGRSSARRPAVHARVA